MFRDELDELCKFYGKNPNRFIYKDAPPRGWQEGKRDFSDKVITVQYNDDGIQNRYQRNYGKPVNLKYKDKQLPLFRV